MLLDTSQPSLDFADEDVVADDGRVVIDDRLPQPGELIARLLPHDQKVGGYVGMQGIHFRADFGNVILGRHNRPHIGPRPYAGRLSPCASGGAAEV